MATEHDRNHRPEHAHGHTDNTHHKASCVCNCQGGGHCTCGADCKCGSECDCKKEAETLQAE